LPDIHLIQTNETLLKVAKFEMRPSNMQAIELVCESIQLLFLQGLRKQMDRVGNFPLKQYSVLPEIDLTWNFPQVCVFIGLKIIM